MIAIACLFVKNVVQERTVDTLVWFAIENNDPGSVSVGKIQIEHEVPFICRVSLLPYEEITVQNLDLW